MSGDRSTAESPAEAAPRALTVGLLVALGGCLAIVVWSWIRAIGYPYPLDYGEGPLLDQGVRLAGGTGIYDIPGAEPPWTISNYPPLYPLVQAAGSWLFGPAYWYGRLVSVLSALGAGVFAGLIVKTITGDRLAAGVTAVLVPVMPYVGFWAGLARIDLLALMLSLAGLYCVVRWPRVIAGLAAGVVLLAAAGMTRQTYLLAAPLAAFVWLLFVGWRRALIFAGCLVALVGLIGLVLNWASGGGFWFNVVTANVNPWSLDTLLQFVGDVVFRLPILIGLAIGFVVVAVRRRPRSARIVLPYLVAATLVALTIGKVGSNVNYLLEFSVALCLAAGCLIAAVRPSADWLWAVLAALVLQSLGLFFVQYGNRGALDDRAGEQRLTELIATTPGPVLADEDMGLMPLVEKAIVFQPFELTQLANAGVWDQSPLLASVYEQRFGLILVFRPPGYPLEDQRWTPEMLAAIQSAYEVAEQVPRRNGETFVYLPIGRT